MNNFTIPAAQTHACNCIGPQNGQPKCPCMMRGVIERDGRWIQVEVDLGPVRATNEQLESLLYRGCFHENA